MAPSEQFDRAIERFDAANREDPNLEVADGVEQPKELLYARRMTAGLDRFGPDASEAVRLAARCQHIRRWTIPRTDYPEGRNGYRRWRTDLARFHASTAAAILREVGYDDATVARVESLLCARPGRKCLTTAVVPRSRSTSRPICARWSRERSLPRRPEKSGVRSQQSEESKKASGAPVSPSPSGRGPG